METFHLHLSWQGSTAEPTYGRNATATTPGKPDLHVSSGAGEGADPSRWNPEDLFGASLAQCHTLTFLALAQKIRADVRRIETAVKVDLIADGRIQRIGTVTLTASIFVAPGADVDKVAMMYDKAHKYCFIANSSTAEVVLVPTVLVED